MANKLIIPRITGGLGNQLFIYAAARRMALVNGAELALDDKSGFVHDVEYRRSYQLDHFSIPCRKATPKERLEPFSRFRRYVIRKFNQRLPFEQRRYLMQEKIDFDADLLKFKPRGTVYLEGYWQSEDYFKSIAPQIRADLRIRPPTDIGNQQIARHIRSTNAIAVHIRFFDDPTSSVQGRSGNNVPSDYYQRAINCMEERASNAHYFIFSDNPRAAKAYIPLPDNRFTLVNHNHGDSMAYADLWLMSQCRNFVIANSTFSWWAGWLSENTNKLIIAPLFSNSHPKRVTSWGFKGLIPTNWILL